MNFKIPSSTDLATAQQAVARLAAENARLREALTATRDTILAWRETDISWDELDRDYDAIIAALATPSAESTALLELARAAVADERLGARIGKNRRALDRAVARLSPTLRAGLERGK